MQPGDYSEDESLVVRKHQVSVVLSFFDGHREEAIMLVPRQDVRRMSFTRRMAYFFNEPTNFLSFRSGDDEPNLMVRKSRIRWVELDSDITLEKDDYVGICQEIWISFPKGDVMRGNVYNVLPSGRRRVLDFLNQSEMFFPMETDDGVHLVNTSAAVRVYVVQPAS